MLQRNVRGEESNERCLGVESERIVVEVDRVQFWEGQQSGKERGKCLRDFVQQTSCKYVG